MSDPSSWVRDANAAGKSGRYFRVRNCASENGLSLDTRGRERERVTPRSSSSADTGFVGHGGASVRVHGVRGGAVSAMRRR